MREKEKKKRKQGRKKKLRPNKVCPYDIHQQGQRKT